MKLIKLQAPAEDPELDSATLADLSAAVAALPPLMIHPHSSFRSAWDILTLFLLLYCVFSIPYQMSFSSDVPKYYVVPGTEDDSESAVSGVDIVDYIDLIVDAVFMVDVVINLRTAFLRPHATRSLVLETRGPVVAMRYLKTSFVPDVVSSLPYQWIAPIINEVAGFSKGTSSLDCTTFRYSIYISHFHSPPPVQIDSPAAPYQVHAIEPRDTNSLQFQVIRGHVTRCFSRYFFRSCFLSHGPHHCMLPVRRCPALPPFPL